LSNDLVAYQSRIYFGDPSLLKHRDFLETLLDSHPSIGIKSDLMCA